MVDAGRKVRGAYENASIYCAEAIHYFACKDPWAKREGDVSRQYLPILLLGLCLAASAQNLVRKMPNGCSAAFAQGATIHRAEGDCHDGHAIGDWQILATVNNQIRWFHTFYNHGVQDGFSMVLHQAGGDIEVRDAEGKVVWRSSLPKGLTANSADKVEALLEKANYEAVVHRISTRMNVGSAKQAVLRWVSDRAAFFALPAEVKSTEVRPRTLLMLDDDPKARGRSARVQ